MYLQLAIHLDVRLHQSWNAIMLGGLRTAAGNP